MGHPVRSTTAKILFSSPPTCQRHLGSLLLPPSSSCPWSASTTEGRSPCSARILSAMDSSAVAGHQEPSPPSSCTGRASEEFSYGSAVVAQDSICCLTCLLNKQVYLPVQSVSIKKVAQIERAVLYSVRTCLSFFSSREWRTPSTILAMIRAAESQL